MATPTAYNDVIFPSAPGNINAVLSELKRDHLSVKNRLHSIVQDAQFVENVADGLDLPLVANERCGSWYIRPQRKAGSAYFKSTDGHSGQWSFSLRRLNLHLLEVIEQGRGCIIVDSTRRGKSMPDAISKTVPIWITVLNRLIFPEQSLYHALRTASAVVSQSEHSQIESRIAGFVEEAQSLCLDIEKLKATLQRPLRPAWVTPATSSLADVVSDDAGSWPVVLCTASSCDSLHPAGYVQGAADDHESWARGLTAEAFWRHQCSLLNISGDDLELEIARIVHAAGLQTVHRPRTLVPPTTRLFITNNASVMSELDDVDFVVYCSAQADPLLEAGLTQAKRTFVHLACGEGKIGSRQLRHQLEKLKDATKAMSSTAKILCACPSGRDLAVGVSLAILCTHYAEDGQLCVGPAVNKAIIKQKLSWIMVSMPDAAPSRATLQSINAYLMG